MAKRPARRPVTGQLTRQGFVGAPFSGTSSASPIVTGAIACLQGRAKAKTGAFLTPKKVRQILMSTGTPQAPGPGVPLSQRIGPLVNLPRAMKKI